MKMEVLRTKEPDYEVILGPCPGCLAWQVDYTSEVAHTYMQVLHEPSEGTVNWEIDARLFQQVVEDIFADHYAECPHLREWFDKF